jgi:hypothetical protein
VKPNLPIKRTEKRLLSQLHQHQQPSNLELEDGDDDEYDDVPNAHVGYRRPQLIPEPDLSDPDIDLPDHILARLADAREQAMKAYRGKRT